LLDEGFHRLERDGERVWRWTNGLTRLPALLWADCPDGCFLRLDHDNDPLPRWIAPAREAGQSDAPFLERRLGARAQAWRPSSGKGRRYIRGAAHRTIDREARFRSSAA
jgi:hypothetical protein